MSDIKKMTEDLKQNYDEIKLKVHLGSKEAQDEWTELQERWHHFESQANLKRARKISAMPSRYSGRNSRTLSAVSARHFDIIRWRRSSS